MTDPELDRILGDDERLEASVTLSAGAMRRVHQEVESGMPRRRPLHHAWPGLGMGSIIVTLIAATRWLADGSSGDGIPEPVRWLGLTVAGSIALGRWSNRLLGKD